MSYPHHTLPEQLIQGYEEVANNLDPKAAQEQADYLLAEIRTIREAEPNADLSAEDAALQALLRRLQ